MELAAAICYFAVNVLEGLVNSITNPFGFVNAVCHCKIVLSKFGCKKA